MGNGDENLNRFPGDAIINPQPINNSNTSSQYRSPISSSLGFFISWFLSLYSFLDYLLSGRISNWIHDIYSTTLYSIVLGFQNDIRPSSDSGSDSHHHHHRGGLLRYNLSANFLPGLNTRFIPFIPSPSLSREFQLGLATIRLTLLSTTGFLVLSIIGYFPDFVQDFLPSLTFGGGVISLGLTLNATTLPVMIATIIQIGNSSIFFIFFRIIGLLLGSNYLVFIPCVCFLLIVTVFIWLITRGPGGGGGGGGPGGDGDAW